MAYNNYGNYNQNYNFSQNRGSWRPSRNYQRSQKKHSGAKKGYANGERDRYFITGWNYSRRYGMRTFIAGPNKKTKRVKSQKSGREWDNWTCKMTTGNGVQLLNCLYDVAKDRVIINDLNIVINPNAPNGGYCGKLVSKNRR